MLRRASGVLCRDIKWLKLSNREGALELVSVLRPIEMLELE
jgi:hypothetical protein